MFIGVSYQLTFQKGYKRDLNWTSCISDLLMEYLCFNPGPLYQSSRIELVQVNKRANLVSLMDVWMLLADFT